MLEEEARHLSRSVGSPGVGVRAGEASARPSVPEPVDGPLLHDGAIAAGVVVGDAGVGVPVGHSSVALRGLGHRPVRGISTAGGDPVREQAVRISRINGRVAIPMEHDRRYDPGESPVEVSWGVRPGPPCRIAANAEERSWAAPGARPEWTPIAA